VNRFAQVGQSTVPERPPIIARQFTGGNAPANVHRDPEGRPKKSPSLAASSRAQPFFRRSEGSCAESSRGVVEMRVRSLAPLVKTRGFGMTPSTLDIDGGHVTIELR